MGNLYSILLATRPYSWVGAVLLGLLAYVAATESLAPSAAMLLDIFTALLLWTTGLLFIEYFQRKNDKRISSATLPIISLALLVSLIAIRNYVALLLVPVMFIASIIYALKTRSALFGRASFLLRGLWDVIAFVILLMSHGACCPGGHYPVILAIYLLSCSRNLVGDIRDVAFDRHTFPRVFGTRAGYAVSAALALISVLVIRDIYVMFPVIVTIALIAFVRDARLLHRTFVLTTAFFLSNTILMLLGRDAIFTNILFVAAVLSSTYSMVPRRSNPT